MSKFITVLAVVFCAIFSAFADDNQFNGLTPLSSFELTPAGLKISDPVIRLNEGKTITIAFRHNHNNYSYKVVVKNGAALIPGGNSRIPTISETKNFLATSNSWKIIPTKTTPATMLAMN